LINTGITELCHQSHLQLQSGWCHCSETTSTDNACGSGFRSSCVWWCTKHFLARHHLM